MNVRNLAWENPYIPNGLPVASTPVENNVERQEQRKHRKQYTLGCSNTGEEIVNVSMKL